MKTNKPTAVLLSLLTALFMTVSIPIAYADNENETAMINIDLNSVSDENIVDSFGISLGGGTLSLIDDYSEMNYESYMDICRFIAESGIDRIRLEISSGINTYASSEPCLMSDKDSIPDFGNSPSWKTASEIKRIAPDIKIEVIAQSDPLWVSEAFETSSENGYEARYSWYIQMIKNAYTQLGFVPDYICADSLDADRTDKDWCIYLAGRLKRENRSEPDTSKIRLCICDNGNNLLGAEELAADPFLEACVDTVICCGSKVTEKEKNICKKYGKEIVFCPESQTSGYRISDFVDEYISSLRNGTALSSIYGVSSFYDGMKYFSTGFIACDDPESGEYSVLPIYDTYKLLSGNISSNSCIIRSVNSADAAAVTERLSPDFSVILKASDQNTKNCRFVISNAKKTISKLYICRCDTQNNFIYDTVTPKKLSDSSYSFEYELPCGYFAVISSKELYDVGQKENRSESIMSLPYSDDFSYDEEHIFLYGTSPKLSCIVGGDFKVIDSKLCQTMNSENKPIDSRHNASHSPLLYIGDHDWTDYNAEISVCVSGNSKTDYAGIGIRCSGLSGKNLPCGYTLSICGDGSWIFRKDSTVIDSGKIKGFKNKNEYKLRLEADVCHITAKINDNIVSEYDDSECAYINGRIALFSSFSDTSFDDLFIHTDSGRIGSVNSHTIGEASEYVTVCNADYTYRDRDHIIPTGPFTFTFEGTGFAVIGSADGSVFTVSTDDDKAKEGISVSKAERCALFVSPEYPEGTHSVCITPMMGNVYIDEIYTFKSRPEEVKETTEETEIPADENIIVTEATEDNAEPNSESEPDTNASIVMIVVSVFAILGVFALTRKKK